jgi:hypothetical protein
LRYLTSSAILPDGEAASNHSIRTRHSGVKHSGQRVFLTIKSKLRLVHSEKMGADQHVGCMELQ